MQKRLHETKQIWPVVETDRNAASANSSASIPNWCNRKCSACFRSSLDFSASEARVTKSSVLVLSRLWWDWDDKWRIRLDKSMGCALPCMQCHVRVEEWRRGGRSNDVTTRIGPRTFDVYPIMRLMSIMLMENEEDSIRTMGTIIILICMLGLCLDEMALSRVPTWTLEAIGRTLKICFDAILG